MEEDDALSSLQSRLSAATLSQPSRASRTPIDSTPESFMGASVGAKSGDEDSDAASLPVKSSELKATSKQSTRDPGAAKGEEVVHRRRVARRRPPVQTAAVDPDLLNKMIAGEGINPPQEEQATPPIPAESKPIEKPPEPKKSPPTSLPPPGSAPVVAPTPVAVAVPAPVSVPVTSEESGGESFDELAGLRKKHAKVVASLEDFEELCKSLELEVGAVQLAQYIGNLQEANEKYETLRSEHASTKETCERLMHDLDAERLVQKQLRATIAARKEGEDTGGADERVAQLEQLCAAKDQEIGELKVKLAASLAATGVLSVEGLEEGEEGEIVAQAERELQLMDELIREQESFLRELEKEMETEVGSGAEQQQPGLQDDLQVEEPSTLPSTISSPAPEGEKEAQEEALYSTPEGALLHSENEERAFQGLGSD